MASNDESNIMEQVGSRLDDLFGEDAVKDSEDAPLSVEHGSGGIGQTSDSPAPEGRFNRETQPANAKETHVHKIDAEEIENSPIKELKSIVLSLEWEITDQVMEKLEEEIRKLETLCQSDKVILAYLQLLGSLGKYIRKKLARAHVDSITLLHSVYDSLEKAMLSKDMSDAAKKKILIAHVTQYKKLKQDIQSARKPGYPGKPSESHRPAPTVTPETEYDARQIPSDFRDLTHMTQEILKSMREIQQTIQNEFTVLRGEIRRLLEEKK
ncbi:hypothetical protein [Desulfococcus sp.]|uniref:hypothetical protein n=1 Tax=Desulfococcus sp. TaxID=2025834 RepID=UPI0035940DF5